MRLVIVGLPYVFAGSLCALFANAQSSASVGPADQTKVQTEATPAQDPKPATVLAPEDEEWLKKASLQVKAGQLFIFGFMGHDLQRGLDRTLKNLKPGALIVFGRNIKSARQVIDLNYEAQKAAIASAGRPLLIAVDQEGGNVIRIRTSPPLPSALALGEAGSPELVYSAGFQTGRLLKELGFNMNLAPVLDVADPKKDPFVGTRTFGKDPEIVSRMGVRFAAGLYAAGVLPTSKHFPGHGGVADSHLETPVKDASLESINKKDLLPFAFGFREIPDSAVMLAHIAYPKIDASGVPATFSKVIVGDLLRRKMGFDGLVMTDDVEMAGAAQVKDPAERAVRAIEAGVDMVMIAWNKKLQSAAVQAVVKAVKSGRISEERLDESVRRVLRAKRALVPALPKQRMSAQKLQAVLRNSEMQRLTLDTLNRQFENSLALLVDKAVLKETDRPIFVFSGTERFFSGFKEKAKNRQVRFFRLRNERTFDINRVLRANPSAIGVFHLSGRQSARFANQLEADTASRVLLVNSETVSLLKSPAGFRHIVDVYFRHPELGAITAQYFFSPEQEAAPKSALKATPPPSSPEAAAEPLPEAGVEPRQPASSETQQTE